MIAEATKQWSYCEFKTPLIHWKGIGWYEYIMTTDKRGTVTNFYAGFKKWVQRPDHVIERMVNEGWIPYVKTDNYVGLRRLCDFTVFQLYDKEHVRGCTTVPSC